jgi:hypothetical protein
MRRKTVSQDALPEVRPGMMRTDGSFGFLFEPAARKKMLCVRTWTKLEAVAVFQSILEVAIVIILWHVEDEMLITLQNKQIVMQELREFEI